MGWAIIECPCCGARMELGKHISMQTRADGIRSMSDEELATKLYLFTCVHVFDSKVKCEDNGCKKCWLDWLKGCAE